MGSKLLRLPFACATGVLLAFLLSSTFGAGPVLAQEPDEQDPVAPPTPAQEQRDQGEDEDPAPLPEGGPQEQPDDDAEPIPEEEPESEPLFQVHRIELNLFGGYMWGDTYLQLPDILDPLITFDQGADLIVDFNDDPVPSLRAPQKEMKAGIMLGGFASFYLGKNFGMQLMGSYGRSEAVLTGQTDLDDNRFEVDRTDVEIFRGAGNIIYNLGREEKWPVRPYVNLGFGGVLNKYPAVDDVTALFFLYGGGFSGPLFGNFRWDVGGNFTLYTFETDEVSLDSMVTFPALFAGVTWRYDVPGVGDETEEQPVGLGQ